MADAVFGWARKLAAADGLHAPVADTSTELSPPPPAPKSCAATALKAAVACGMIFASALAGAAAALPGGLAGTARSALLVSSAGSPPRPCPPPPRLDFFEVGCSDFNTEVQAAAAGPHAQTVRGMSVDAVPLYTRRLPQDLPHAKVVNAAVVGWPRRDGGGKRTVPVFYTPPEDIAAHGLPDWMRGCNSVGRPHPTAASVLEKAGLSHLMREEEVPVRTLAELLTSAGGCRVGTFKVDVEGMDAELLTAYAAFLWAHPACRADRVVFEVNELSAPADIDAARAALAAVGYPASAAPASDPSSQVAEYVPGADSRRSMAAAVGSGRCEWGST